MPAALQQWSLVASALFDPCRMPSKPGVEQVLFCTATCQQCMKRIVSAGGHQERHGCSSEEAL